MSAAAYFGGSSDPVYWVSGTSYAEGKIIRSPSDHQLYTRIVAGAGATDPSADSTNWRPEGMRAIKSIQRGTITTTTSGSSPTTGSATISAVNTAKTELRFLGSNTNGAGNMSDSSYRIALTNSTTVTATAAAGNDGITQNVSWELTEYY